jgi:PAS domain S-box-containing protein
MSFFVSASGFRPLSGWLNHRTSALHFSRWTIGTRIAALVLALVVPLNLVIFAVIGHLAESAGEMQRTSLLYTARSVAAAVDAKLGEYITLTQVLARSPALLEASLDAFEAEARRAFLSREDGWMIVADLEGQQLLNTAAAEGERLPIRNSISLEAQRQALEKGSAAVSKVQFGRVSRSWIIDIVVPVFKNGQPFRALSVSLKAEAFLRLLSNQQIPRNWLASIIDGDGRIIARVPAVEGIAGQLTSTSWRKVMHEDGVFDLVSIDGDPIVSAQARPIASEWLVGIAVKKAEMEAAVWGTIRWAALFGGGLSVLSLLLAGALSRHITGPIAEIRRKAPRLVADSCPEVTSATPEIRDLWRVLKKSVADRNRSDEALRESEERFRGIYEHAGIGIAIASMEAQFQFCNPAYTAMLGYSEDELRRIDFSALIHPSDREANLAQSQRLLAGQIPSFEIINRYVGKRGRVIWVQKHISLLRDASGRPTNMIALVTDITERKQYEEQIRETKERLQLALDAAQLGTWRRSVTEGAEVAECDMRCRTLLGLPPGATLTYEVLTGAILPEDRSQVKVAVERALDPADPHDDYAGEYRIKHRDGKVLWLSAAGRAFFEPDPVSKSGRHAVCIAGTLRDVTEAHLARTTRESEERLRSLGDSLPESAVYRYVHEPDRPPCFHHISAGVEQLNGVRVEDVLRDARVLFGQILPEYLQQLQEAERRSAADMSDFRMEMPMRRPDGEVRWMRVQSRPHRGADGAVIWDGVQTDITEQKRAEAALRESEEKLRLALDAAKLGIWRWELGPDAKEMQWDSRCRELFGVAPDAIVTYETWANSIPPGHRARAEANVVRALDPAELNDETVCEYPVKHSGATVRWLSSIGRAFFEPDPQSPSGRRAVCIAGAIHDVTGIHNAQSALRDSEERLRLSNEAAGIGTFTIDFEAGCTHISPEIAAMLGVPAIRTVPIEDTFAQAHRDDLKRTLAEYEAGLKGAEGGLIKMEFRFVRPGGEVRWMTWTGRVHFREGAEGRTPFRITGVCIDITGRKQQEDQIRLLMHEVNHRSKNLLTVVQAIARQTAAASPADFLPRFGKRIEALSVNQDLLVKNGWRGVDLAELVRSQLAHFEDLIGMRIEIDGQQLFVSASAAQTIAMALHELATNAGKYGALSTIDGLVSVGWGLERTEEKTRTFVMRWIEQNACPITAPSKRGFGSTVIADLAEKSLNAKVKLDFLASGLSWRLQCPANEVLQATSSPPAENQKNS